MGVALPKVDANSSRGSGSGGNYARSAVLTSSAAGGSMNGSVPGCSASGGSTHKPGKRGGKQTHSHALPASAGSASGVRGGSGGKFNQSASPDGSPLFDDSRKLSDENGSPIPLGGRTASGTGGVGTSLYATVEDVVGDEGSGVKYIKRETIGKGAYGDAYIVQRNPDYDPSAHCQSEKQYASNTLAKPTTARGLYVAKVMDLRSMQVRERQYTQTEITCLAHTDHFAIIKYYEHYVLDAEGETMIIITEFADHGDLHRNLNRAREVGSGSTARCLQLSEKEAGTYFVQILLALHHIHRRRMIHRDVKSANLFLTSRGFIKLGDFGFSRKYESTVSSETIAGTFLGTPYYLSPEMWQGKRYGKKADVWAAGVVLYEMLMDGQRPYDGNSLPELRESVMTTEVDLPQEPPVLSMTSQDGPATNEEISPVSSVNHRGKFSQEMRELVRWILHKDPNQRPSTEDLLHTPIMHHYLFLFEKHVQSLIAADEVRLAQNPNCDPFELNFPDPADKKLVLQGIEDAHATVAETIKKEVAESASPRYEGVVYKGNHKGEWRARYLVLADGKLTISLAKGKEGGGGGSSSSSKPVPLCQVAAFSPCEVEDAHVRLQPSPTVPESTSSRIAGFKPPYAFAIMMQSSNSITFGVGSAAELDGWLSTLMRALQVD